MASETQVQDHGTHVHVEEKKVSDFVEGADKESVSPSKENEGNDAEKKLEVEEPAISEASVVDSEKKMDDIVVEKKVEKEEDKDPNLNILVDDNSKVLEKSELKPDLTEVAEKKEPGDQSQVAYLPVPLIEVVEKTVEHSEATHAHEQVQPKELSESAKEIVEKNEELPVVSDTPTVVETKKVEEVEKAPDLDVLVDDNPKVLESSEQTPDLTVEVEKKVPEEQSKISVIAEPLTEVLEKPVEHSEASHVQEPNSEVGIGPRELSEVVSEIVEKSEDLSEISPVQGSESVTDPKEQLNVIPEVTAEVDKISETLTTKGSTQDEISIGENLAQKLEKDAEPLKEVVDSSNIEDECVKDKEVEPDNKEVGRGIVVPEILETSNGDSKTESDGVEVLVKEAAVGAGLLEPTTENEVNVEDKAEKEETDVKIDESTPPETTKTGEAGGSISSNEITKRSFEFEKAPIDAEATTKESKLEVEPEAPLVTGTDKLEKSEEKASIEAEKVVEEVKNEENEKSDAPKVVESAKDGGDLKTGTDVPKQEAPARPTQRHSNILSKVKQSFVKAKKAILGKSPSSKTLSSEAKGDIKVK